MSRIRHKHFTPVAPDPMPPDPDLFEPPLSWTASLPFFAPAQPVDTSLEAAAKITKHTARIREAIFLWLKTQGSHGATAGEICTALGLSGSTVRPRIREAEGTAPWCHGKLPARIKKTEIRRNGMRVYVVI